MEVVCMGSNNLYICVVYKCMWETRIIAYVVCGSVVDRGGVPPTFEYVHIQICQTLALHAYLLCAHQV